MALGDTLDAVLFDFDGVICDSVDVKTQAFAAMYEPHGQTMVDTVVAYHMEHGGISRFEKFRYYESLLHGDLPSEDTVQVLSERFAKLVVQKVIESKFIPGAIAALQALKGECPMYVVSGTPEDELRQIVDARGLGEYFLGVFGSPRSKHDIIVGILGEHGYKPHHCVMVGDAMTDYHAAKSSSVRFLGVTGGHDSPFPGDTSVVDDLTAFPGALAQATNC